MQVAEKTVAFVKEWIEGKYTKRQYQNYYTVKTEHAEFLLKLTEKRELLATKDKTGHVYIWDENNDDDNAFSQLIDPSSHSLGLGFVWPNGYTRLNSYKMGSNDKDGSAVNQISKFRVCERITINNPKLAGPLYLTLFALGNRRFYTLPERSPYGKPISLKTWATFEVEAEFPYCVNSVLLKATETLPNLEKIADIRGHYMALAGDKLEVSTIVENGWIIIPTDYQTVEEISGLSLLEMRKTRPNPFAYGVSAAHFDMDKLMRRYETTEENVELLTKAIVTNRQRSDLPDPAANWEFYMLARYPIDMAKNYIAYIKADDQWLADNYAAAHACALEYQLRTTMGAIDGWVFGGKCDDARFGPCAIYMKNNNLPFLRVLPVPAAMPRIFGEVNDYE